MENFQRRIGIKGAIVVTQPNLKQTASILFLFIRVENITKTLRWQIFDKLQAMHEDRELPHLHLARIKVFQTLD